MNENNNVCDNERFDYERSFDIKLKPVGIIKNRIETPFLIAKDGNLEMQGELDATMKRIREVNNSISEIYINDNLTNILDGIEKYSHIVVLYWAHKISEEGRTLTKVHPMGRKEIPSVGIFSTCSPARPNPVLMTVVRLCGRKNNVLEVAGIDAIDGSPVIDIKPYVRDFYPQKEVRIPNWMNQIQNEFDERQ